MILLVGGVINAFTGSVGYYLLMTGKQAAALKIIAGSLLVSAALNTLLIPGYGIVGSAIASVVAVSCWNLSMLIYVRRVLGIDASAIGLKAKPSR